MSKEIVVRLTTPAGRSRLTLPATATVADLQEKVKESTSVEPASQQLAFDQNGRPGGSVSTSTPSTGIASLGISNGTMLHLLNKDATSRPLMASKQPVAVEPEKPIAKKEDGSGGGAAASSSSSSAPKPAAASGTGGGKPPQPEPEDPSKKAGSKLESFDAYIRQKVQSYTDIKGGRRLDTSSLPGAQQYSTVEIKPGSETKIPKAVSVKHQPYRHVDVLSVMNHSVLLNFIAHWNIDLLDNAMHRMGWMYGYYLEDKVYNEGTKAVIEAIYEPPQEMVGDMATPKTDPNRKTVDRIAEALGLECIGWIFTAMGTEDGFPITPAEVSRVARLQLENSTDIHFTKYRLSKFVSCVVRPGDMRNRSNGDGPGEPLIKAFQVSDQCVAMVRDGMLTEGGDPTENPRKNCLVREGNKNELVPRFIVEGKTEARRIDPTLFFVPFELAQPKKAHKLFTYSDFPRENRPSFPQQRQHLKKYLQKRSSAEPSWARLGDFHFILYVAQEVDVDTAIEICKAVRDRTEVPEGVTMLLSELAR